MTDALELQLPGVGTSGDTDNISDWTLEQFRSKYGSAITKDGIWEYLYGIMHAPDWREFYRHDLQRNLPRVPLADDFEAFRSAGRKLMDLHIGYETVEEWPVRCSVDDDADEGGADEGAYRIEGRMRWGKHADGREDRSVLIVNSRCRLVGIPPEAHRYEVSGRTPLQWAIDSLRVKHRDSGIIDDPNGWRDWAEDPFNLIRHLRRLIRVSCESSIIIAGLPSTFDPPGRYVPGPVTVDDLLESAKNAQPLNASTGIIYTDEEFEEHLRSQPFIHASE